MKRHKMNFQSSVATISRRLLMAVVAICLLTACSDSDDNSNNNGTTQVPIDAPEWEVLKNISGVSDAKVFTDADGIKMVSFWFTQPVDHNNPSAGTFKQQCVLHYVDADSPVVLHTQGYAMPEKTQMRQLAMSRLLGANYLEVEHRYFGNSQIDPLNWDYNVAVQSTADLHAIVTALKNTKAFRGKWVSTGTSKNGILTALYAYFYPNEVDVYVPFCAPFCTGLETTGIGKYLTNVCGAENGDCQRILKALQALIRDKSRCAEVVALYRQDDKAGYYKNYADDVVFSRFVFDFYINLFKKFAYQPIDGWRNVIPDENSTAEHFYRFCMLVGNDFNKKLKELQTLLGVDVSTVNYYDYSGVTYDDYEDWNEEYWLQTEGDSNARGSLKTRAMTKEETDDIYPVQAAKELGYFLYDYSAVIGDGLMPASQAAIWNEWVSMKQYLKKYNLTYDGGKLMNGFLDFVKNNRNKDRCRMLFVYGGNDPWTGAAIPDPDADDPYVKKYIVPNGVHSDELDDRTHYSAADADYIMSTIKTWFQE